MYFCTQTKLYGIKRSPLTRVALSPIVYSKVLPARAALLHSGQQLVRDITFTGKLAIRI
jgi:hypothetical protein